MRETYCCNCKFSRKEKILPGTGLNGQSYYFGCTNKARGNAVVFEYGTCALYQGKEGA